VFPDSEEGGGARLPAGTGLRACPGPRGNAPRRLAAARLTRGHVGADRLAGEVEPERHRVDVRSEPQGDSEVREVSLLAQQGQPEFAGQRVEGPSR
jgi:hypothetical protein